ncbi:MAG: adenylosuccinate synthase [Phycisphaerae bacterium]|nr:adenylosuccinate synthase [Phycisphaerae bacterium]
MAHSCVVGLQWGDEGKGKIVDLLMAHHDVVVRYGGGANAGHTVVVAGDKFALHQIPSGIIRQEVMCVLANGMVIDPAVLLGEMRGLEERGISPAGRLWVSDRAHVVMPYHRREDALAEAAADQAHKLGTTSRGIGPCYADKVLRYHGIRVGDMLDADRFRAGIARAVAHKNAYFAAVYDERSQLDANAITDEYLQFAEQLRPHVCDTAQLVNERISGRSRVLFEGAQGSMLDVDHGTYPYVTSSAPGVGGVVGGSGVSPRTIKSIVGVVKAYATRVGDGPFPTELCDATGETIRTRGREYGTTTGRPRRCGWFDCVAARYAAMLAGPTHLAVLHMDTLTGMGELRICVGYRRDGRILNSFPAGAYDFAGVEPVYESLPGWDEDVSGCRRFADLPAAARQYLAAIQERVGAPILLVGVGPTREQTIVIED